MAKFPCNPYEFEVRDPLLEAIAVWVISEPVQRLVASFGGVVPKTENSVEVIEYLTEFSKIWDYRAKAKNTDFGSGQRWELGKETFDTAQLDALESLKNQLNLVQGHAISKKQFHHVLVLGGAKLSCLLRTQEAFRLIDSGVVVGTLAFLTSLRSVADSERDATDSYAPDAMTEADLMTAAIESCDLLHTEICELNTTNVNSNKHSYKAEGILKRAGLPFKILAAESSDPDHRPANTGDTYEMFASFSKLSKGDRILLITSPIYTCYQHIDAVRMLSRKYQCSIETTSFDQTNVSAVHGMLDATNYLQEIRSTILSAKRYLDDQTNGD